MFGALLVLTIAFLPVFALQGEEGRLFRPLALAKTFSMAFASLFSITLVPALMVTLLRGRIRPEEQQPDQPLLHRGVPAAAPRLPARAVPGDRAAPSRSRRSRRCRSRGSAPSSCRRSTRRTSSTCRSRCPGISIAEARRLLIWQDGQIRAVPEVARVFGKAGRAETALDPAPLSMFETVVQLQPARRSGARA